MDNLFDMFSGLHEETSPRSRDKDILRAPFGYPGGKDRSIRKLLEYLPPPRDKWIDVCGGSGIVTLNREKSRIVDVYNDRWSGVVAFFKCLRDPVKYVELMDQINLTMHAREEFVYAKANFDNPALGDVERANLFYQMLVQSFSTLGRNWARTLNSKANFKRIIDIDHWRQLHSRFSECQIENMDWKHCFHDYDSPGSVFYVDPPYPFTDTGIYKHKFDQYDHNDLCEYVHTFAKGYVAISSYKNTIYDKYPWDEVYIWDVPVTIDSRSSTDGGNRTYKGEGIARTYECLYVKEAN